MSNDNRISITILPADKTAFLAKMAEAKAILVAYAASLSAAQKKKLPTIGTKRRAMVDTFDQQMAARPELVPSYVDMVEKNKDSAGWVDVADLMVPVLEIMEMLGDTLHLLGADLLVAYNNFYASVQQAAKHGVAGADTLLALLAQFYPKQPTQPPAPPAP